ncbi:hypothetical protein [Aureispira anguillae]|uniref:Uncharacterized protein n=1 Tax=Aureispira anguillae TaxID=2864201 RepID=A0A915VKC7_9BACT|nr:hypothetical protein [Aureispira anguillae]BDS09604.1 hypothetical protein AsAng_0003080 [Aureispira anguillae]
MKIVSCTLLMFFLMFLNDSLLANAKFEQSVDSSGLKISKAAFKEKMSRYTDLMKEEAEFTEAEYIEMVLIDNTYLLFMKNGNPYYSVQTHNEYLDFLKYYMEDILKTLAANKEGCNGGFYSAKHDLCIGGTEPNEKSVYVVF